MTESNALVQKILAGDKNAFRTLIYENQRLVGHVVYRMVKSESDREDLCQEVFIKVYNNLGRFRFESKLSTWIARIAHNSCLNFLEKKKLPLYDDLGDEETKFEPVADVSFQPDITLSKNNLSAILKKEIDKLPALYKTIVTLFHLDEMSYAEIGQTMKLPEGTVKSYLFRARKVLKERLQTGYDRGDL